MPWKQAFEDLKKTIHYLVWASVAFGIVMTLVAMTAISISSYVLYQRTVDNRASIRRSDDTIIALCREMNDHNTNLMIIALDQGVPFHKVMFLLPRKCDATRLRKQYGVTE